jgi:hypothetical protein
VLVLPGFLDGLTDLHGSKGPLSLVRSQLPPAREVVASWPFTLILSVAMLRFLLLQPNLTHWQLTKFVAIAMRISYTARLQDKCNLRFRR